MIPQEKKKYNVVIVDDDEDLLNLMVYVLESEGLDVKVFATGTLASNYFSEKEHVTSTQLLILDRLLPDMDGLDILRQLSKKYQKEMPMVLILSALSAEKDVLTGFEAGAIDYLTKPFSLDVLRDKSLALLSRYKRF